MRVVFDTNTLISSILRRGSYPDKALTLVLKYYSLLSSAATLEELFIVLQRKKFDSYLKYNEREEFYFALAGFCDVVNVKSTVDICRDKKDNKFLELCLDGKADFLITGDKDLLTLIFFHSTKIITPKLFTDIFE